MRHDLDFPAGKPYDANHPPDPMSQDVADVLVWLRKYIPPVVVLEVGEEISTGPAGALREPVIWATYKGVTFRGSLMVTANSPANLLLNLNTYLGVPAQLASDFFIHPERIPEDLKRREPPANPVGANLWGPFYAVVENDPRPLNALWSDARGTFRKTSLLGGAGGLQAVFSGGASYYIKVA